MDALATMPGWRRSTSSTPWWAVAAVALWIALPASARALDDQDGPIPPPPVSPEAMRALAATMDDTQEYIERLIAEKVPCSQGLSWKGRGFIPVEAKMRETCGPWRDAEKAWSRNQDWSIKYSFRLGGSSSCGNMGWPPGWWAFYCTKCPGPYATTVDIIKADAANTRKGADFIACMSGKVAQAQAAEQRARQAKLDEEKKREAAAAARKQEEDRQREQARREQEQRRAQEARDREEQARADAQARERQRKEEIARRYAEEKVEADRRTKEQNEMMVAHIANMKGGGTMFEGSSYLIRVVTLASLDTLPIYSDTTGVDVRSTSSGSLSGGIGVGAAMEVWPYYGRSFGVGAYLNTSFSMLPLVGGSMSASTISYGASGYWGNETGVSLLVDYGWNKRSGAITMDSGGGYIDATADGAGTMAGKALGLGARICTSERSSACEMSWDVSLDFERFANDMRASNSPTALSASMWQRRGWNASVKLATSFPRLGHPNYASSASQSGLLLHLVFGKSWDWFTAH
jgi:hypothetical protein